MLPRAKATILRILFFSLNIEKIDRETQKLGKFFFRDKAFEYVTGKNTHRLY